MDVDSLAEIVTRLRDAGVVECEFDARDRLRRLVLRIPVATDPKPRPETLFEVPSVGLSDPLPRPVNVRDAIRDMVSDNGIPELIDENHEDAREPGPVKAAPSE